MSETSPETPRGSREFRIWAVAGLLAAVLLISAVALVLWNPDDPGAQPTPSVVAVITNSVESDGPAAFTFDPEPLPVGASLPKFEATIDVQTLLELPRQANPDTTIPTRPRFEIERYTIQPGDTVFGIAAQFNLEPDTIIWGNPELADKLNQLVPGTTINILPINGALRVVQTGDTLEKIARVFHGKEEEIIAFAGNDIDPENPEVTVGQTLIIPGGWRDNVVWTLPEVPIATGAQRTTGSVSRNEPGSCAGPFSGPTGGANFVWPANNHYLSGFNYSGSHPGIDIAAGLGAPIYAADTGVVVFSGGSLYGYGNLVIVDHGNGWQTAYAHLSQINYGCGQAISQGAMLGLSGSTGNSSGPHLHFEMRHIEYGRVNPWNYLP